MMDEGLRRGQEGSVAAVAEGKPRRGEPQGLGEL